MTSGVWYKLGAITIGALIIRIGFWGILYYSYNKEPPQKIVLVIIWAPTLSVSVVQSAFACFPDQALGGCMRGILVASQTSFQVAASASM